MSVNAYIARGTSPGAGVPEMAFRQQQMQRNAFVQDRAFQENQNRYAQQSERQATADQMAFGQKTLEILSGLPPEQQQEAYMARVELAAATVGLPEGFDPVQGWQRTKAQLGPYQPPAQAAPDLVETVGPDGNPVLTPRSEAAGMQPYKAPQRPPNRRVVQVVGPDGKPRFEFEDVAVEQGMTPFVENKPPSADQKKAKANIRRLDTSVETYLKLLDKYGTEGFPGQAKLSLKSAHNDLLLELKELYNLGVLNGPDLDIMTEVLMDPTAIMNQRFSGKEVRQVFDQVVAPKIAAAKNTYSEIYGDTIEPISDSDYERMKAEAGI